MKKGSRSVQVGQMGEVLACAELNRRGYFATPFKKNVPEIDILAFDESLKPIPLQVKTFSGNGLPGTGKTYFDVEILKDERQRITRKKKIPHPGLIYIMVKIGERYGEDEFFLLRKRELFEVAFQDYTTWLEGHGWKRPFKPRSLHCTVWKKNLEPYKDNWDIIKEGGKL